MKNTITKLLSMLSIVFIALVMISCEDADGSSSGSSNGPSPLSVEDVNVSVDGLTLTVSWTPPVETNVEGYLVNVVDATGNTVLDVDGNPAYGTLIKEHTKNRLFCLGVPILLA